MADHRNHIHIGRWRCRSAGTMGRKLIAALSWLALLSPAKSLAAQPETARCIAQPHAESCYYIIRYKEVRQYEKPDKASRVLSVGGWAQKAPIDWTRAADTPSGWLPTSIARGPRQITAGWIETRNLAQLGEFRRVAGCWPVASLKYELGDYAFHVKFTPEGRALISEGFRSHVLFTPDLGLVRDREGGLEIFGFEQKTRRLQFADPNDLEKHSDARDLIQFFPLSKLKGCESGLKLESQPPAK